MSGAQELLVADLTRELSCSTGGESAKGECFARRLADMMGVDVEAPTDILFIKPDGTMYVGKGGSASFKRFSPREKADGIDSGG